MSRMFSLGRHFPVLAFFYAIAVFSPLSAQTAVQHLSLNGAWQFRQAAADPGAAARIGNHPETNDWHAAAVPGVVQTDLLANKLIPDPFYRDNEATLQWIGFANWEYRRTVTVTPAQLRQQHADLVFQGLDTFATVFINGRQVLSTDNMFRTWRVDVRPELHAGSNTISVVFRSPLLTVLPQVKAEKHPLIDIRLSPYAEVDGIATSNYVRKAPYNYGWDWGPCFLTSGIWRPTEIEFWSDARIDNVYVHQLDVSPASANLNVEATIFSSRPEQVRAELTEAPWKPSARVQPPPAPAQQQSVWLHPGENHIVFPVNIHHPALWYPVGYGKPDMYRFRVRLREGARLLDEQEAHAGLRTVELLRRPDQWGRSFAFAVNGIPIFAKGASLIPFDSFPPRVPEAQIRQVLDSAVDANMNMLRVWGGGIYQTDRFYELADERGLMIWQEFMFGGALYPHDKQFLDNVQQEAIDQVRRLRNHPSIVLWCGNNETETSYMNWKDRQTFKASLTPPERDAVWGGTMRLFSGILPAVVASNSPGTPYWPSSPSNNFSAPPNDTQFGDDHYWSVWHGDKPFSAFNDQYPRFMSEYGFESLPQMSTIDAFTEPADRTLSSPVMLAHQKNTGGYKIIQRYMDWEFPQPKDFASYIYVSQVLQAEGIKLGTEHLRRNRPHVMGALYWQINDCWPVASWASMDYYGHWKALHYYARRFYQDLLVSPHVRNGNVAVSLISDRTQPVEGTLRVQLMDFSGKVLSSKDIPATLQPLSAAQVWTSAQSDLLKDADPSDVFVHTEFLVGGQPVSTNNLYLLPYKDTHLSPAKIETRWLTRNGRTAVELSSSTLARAVSLDTGSLDAEPSDDFFDLIPGHPVTVVFGAGSAQALRQNLHVVSLSDAFQPAAQPQENDRAAN